MTASTKIEWCDSTFNPWIGCTKISPACDHCYAEAHMDTRLGRVQWGAGNPRSRTSADYWKQPLRWNLARFAQCRICGTRGVFDYCAACCVASVETRRRVFCASLADWLDNAVSIEWLVDLLNLIRLTPNLDWLLLSKRIGNWSRRISEAIGFIDELPYGRYPRLRQWLADWLDGVHAPDNVWMLATVCDQKEADRDVVKLLEIPARVRGLSIEPMLGPVNLRHLLRYQNPGLNINALTGVVTRGQLGMAPGECSIGVTGAKELPALDWIICGGESGPHARPMHPDWARSLRDQCAAAGVPFLFKRWGEYCHPTQMPDDCDGSGSFLDDFMRVGKHAAGRLLDDRKHLEWPA